MILIKNPLLACLKMGVFLPSEICVSTQNTTHSENAGYDSLSTHRYDPEYPYDYRKYNFMRNIS